MAPPRILLCGDVFGRLNQLTKRVSSVNKSAGPFDALLCVGQFFPDSPEQLEEFIGYIDGHSKFPLPTYFIGDYGVGAPKILSAASIDSAKQGFKMDGLKICDNLFWLKGSGKFFLNGLSIVYLSGKDSSSGPQIGTFSQDDVDALRALADEPGIIDMFLTNEWPSGITNRAASSDVPPGALSESGSSSTVANLVSEIKPRYHISGTKGVFYSREPYNNFDAVHVTRFIGLASVGNKDKQKFVHAISPTPSSTMTASELSMKASNTTMSPFGSGEATNHTVQATKRHDNTDPDSQYWRYDVSKKRQKHGESDSKRLCFKFLSSGSCPRENCHFQHDEDAREQYQRGVCFDFLNKGQCERGPDCSFKHSLQEEGKAIPNRRSGQGHASGDRSRECWFCLSSPNVESHLICSVGEYYYCALPKGQLVEDHILLVPIEHIPNTLSSSHEGESELNKYQSSLTMYFKSQAKDVVFFEWVSKRSTHANLQVVPIPSSRTSIIRDIFNLAAQKLGFEFLVLTNDSSSEGRRLLQKQFDRNSSLFYVQLPGDTIIYHPVEENEKFPAQFGREVLAGLFNKPDRDDWRNCKLSKEEEEEMVESFKSRFGKYDPNQ
ncbi:zinc finger CCCH domain-containing protein 64 [Impatiens glandulifera]|uniref:zinc finger CCCH domain-containing protein 64 n=1 Tax=Impatiens glandulifera TaxID=253017 RepID=UPI001FB0F36F|nr:zinc finger CCCH domain-containing protein 64 [Impatiens glandulifera]